MAALILAALGLALPARAQLGPAQQDAQAIVADAQDSVAGGDFGEEAGPVTQEEARRPPLPVSSSVWRSARPDEVAIARLYSLGVRTILNLESPAEHADEVKRIEKVERSRAQAGLPPAHIDSINDPMGGLSRPRFIQIDRALAVLGDPAKAPVLVHCKHGQDRTGVVVAAYRVALEHWTIERAVAEAKSLGCCHLVLPGQDALSDFLSRYAAHRRSRAQSRAGGQ